METPNEKLNKLIAINYAFLICNINNAYFQERGGLIQFFVVCQPTDAYLTG